MKLVDYLSKSCASESVQKVIMGLAHASFEVYQALKKETIGYGQTHNSSGEVQLSHDILADDIYTKALHDSQVVSCMVSEERESELCFVDGVDNKLLVAYDPIDGSSVASAGLAVGSAVGIYEGVDHLIEAKGTDQVASFYVLYGSRMILVLSVGEGVQLFTYHEDTRTFHKEKENIDLDQIKSVCGFGGMQHSCEIGGFPDLISYWQKEHYSLRYSGSMAADINGLFYRGGGVFVYPAEKLRVLYECNPFAFLVEQAGGKAVDINGVRLLEKTIDHIDQTSSVVIGHQDQVDKVMEYFTDLRLQKGCGCA